MLYSIIVTAGLEKIAHQELTERFGDTGKLKILGPKPQRIFFHYTGEPSELLSMRTAEHLFLVLRRFPRMTRSRRSLTALSTSLARFNFSETFTCCRKAGIRIGKRVMFRVTSRLSGQRNFRRLDLQRVVERALQARGWHLTHAQPLLDFWAEIHGDDGYLSIRLSPIEMAQRSYKQAHIPASLKPTLAYSMVKLSQPHPNDVFLDAMCGAGTILLERASLGRYRYLIGGDISTDALAATQTNFGRKHRPRQFFQWDACNLPLRAQTVDKIVCNLPFGLTHGNASQLMNLYRHCFRQFATVLKPRGCIVLLTSQRQLLETLLKQHQTLKAAQRFAVDVRGTRAWIFRIIPK